MSVQQACEGMGDERIGRVGEAAKNGWERLLRTKHVPCTRHNQATRAASRRELD